MSAKNRGTESRPSDFYPTPEVSIRNFLSNFKLQDGDILEPCAGNGNISKIIKELYPKLILDQVELREEEKEKLEQFGNVYIENFLSWRKEENKKYKTIITNPPFTYAKEFIKKSFEIADDDTEIIMLLRVAYLESKERYKFWQEYPVQQLYILSNRPSFTGKGTDATAYAFFVWTKKESLIKVI